MANIFIPDITQISEAAWREERKKGIGGSDVGAILGFSSYKTVFDLYYEKIGATTLDRNSENDRIKSKITKKIGKWLEPFVAELFSEKYPDIQVLTDNRMYQHEQYPFMLANIDRMLILPNGQKAILEIKTVTNAKDWQSTDFCRGIQGRCPISYEYQGRHYMACLDVDLVVFCGLDLVTKELYIVYMNRDKQIEQQIIEAESYFWDLVVQRTPPNVSQRFCRIAANIKAEAFKRFYGAVKDVTYYINTDEEVAFFNEILELKKVQSFHENLSKQAKEEKEKIAMKLFMMAEDKTHVKPSRIELFSNREGMETKQYITLSETTSVSFDKDRFLAAYNLQFPKARIADANENTAILLCRQTMPEHMGEFITLGKTSARMNFSDRTTKAKRKKTK